MRIVICLQEVGAFSNYIKHTDGLELSDQRDLVMTSLLHCNLLGNTCLDLLVCEFSREESPYRGVEREAITMVLYQVMSSPRVEEGVKTRIRTAARAGKQETCHQFQCSLDNMG